MGPGATGATVQAVLAAGPLEAITLSLLAVLGNSTPLLRSELLLAPVFEDALDLSLLARLGRIVIAVHD